jgi:general secretion pathway protein A
MPSPYLTYFNLKEEPFSTVPNPRFFSLTPTHSSAMGKTKFTVDAKKGLATVIGDTGTGKSTLARLLHEKFLEEGYVSVLLTNPSFPTPNTLLRTIVQEYQIPRTSKAYKENLDLFKAFLYQQALEQGKTLVLIIDEAQTLRRPLLELLRQLMNYETNEMKLLQLVLFAQDELRNKLSHPSVKNFRSRIAMASTLDRVGIDELKQMVEFRWLVASGRKDHPFTSDAIEALFFYSEGIPREACIIADNALLAAFLSQQETIDKAVIEYAARERNENTMRVKPTNRK